MRNAKTCLNYLLLVFLSATAMLCVTRASAVDPKGKPAPELKGIRIWEAEKGTKWNFHSHTATEHKHIFTGTIEIVGAKINGASGIGELEKGDSWTINTDKKHVTFKLTTNGKWDKIDLKLNHRAEKLIFDIKEDGEPMKTERIHIGEKNEHPKSSHFTVPG